MIQFRNVSKTFQTKKQTVQALKNINLTIRDGDIFGIIGYSGAGKSTLLRCINQLERPSEGDVIVNGIKLNALNERELRRERKKIGMIFQHFNLMRSRNVYQNIAFPLKGTSLSKKEQEAKIIELLELVSLSDKRDAYPSQLSGGQKQRVAIARALASDPDILLCDEATSALDPQTTKSILKLLKQVNERLGITIVLITHEMAVVKEICNRIAVMENGHIVEEGTILDIFTHPQHATSKSFIDTVSSMSRIHEMMEEEHACMALKEGQWLVKLCYDAESTNKALLSEISRIFQVDANIIYGNVEVIQNVGLGNLAVILEGTEKAVKEAIQYLENHAVKVEVLKTCTNL